MSERPPIPGPVKRVVRQRCGFGCVICGLPLYEYDHLAPFAEVEEHDPKNLVLLCDRHHREKTSGLLTAEQVATANQTPRNLETGESHPFGMHYEGMEGELEIGGNHFVSAHLSDGSPLIAVMVDDTPIVGFSFEDGRLLLMVQLFNEANELLLQIAESELVYSTSPWDVEFVGRRLTVRHDPGDIFVSMILEPPTRVVVDRGRLWRNGVELQISPSALQVGGMTMSDCGMTGCDIGVAVGENGLAATTGIALPSPFRQPFGFSAEVEGRILRAAPHPQTSGS